MTNDGNSPSESSRPDTLCSSLEDGIGVYVHFPYCLKKCPYCDFASLASSDPANDQRGYAEAVLFELGLRQSALTAPVTSVFFGGGTPSLWAPTELGRVLSALAPYFASSDIEITMECNPTSIDYDRARQFLDQGINRMSIGVQSLDPERLRFLGRLHTADGGILAVKEALRAGVPRVSADLIFGVQGGRAQSPEEAANEATMMVETGISHLSAYGLTIEPGTNFGAEARKGRLPIAPEERHVESFWAVEAALARHGFLHYEISNYARPGEQSRHNLGYWRGMAYLGLGAGAVGCLPSGSVLGQEPHPANAGRSRRRYKNDPSPVRYSAALRRGQLVECESEDLSQLEQLRERIMLGLRTTEGVAWEASHADLGLAPSVAAASALERHLSRGTLVRSGGFVAVNSESRLLTDAIAVDLF